MNAIILFEDDAYANFLPLTYWRSVFELQVGRHMLLDRAAQMLGAPIGGVWTRDWMAPVAALRCGAPLFHGWLLRRLDLISFQGGVEPVPAPVSSGDPAADEAALTQALAERLQGLIQAHPEQWSVARPSWPAESPGAG